MAAVLDPVVKTMYLCDDLVSDPETGKPHLIGLFDTVWTNERLVVAQLCVVVQFVSGIGDIPMRIRITETRTGRIVYTTPVHRVSFSSRHRTVYACFRIRECRVSRPGIHFAELFVRDRFVDDRRLRIRNPLEG